VSKTPKKRPAVPRRLPLTRFYYIGGVKWSARNILVPTHADGETIFMDGAPGMFFATRL